MAGQRVALSGQAPAAPVTVDFDAYLAEQEQDEPVTLRVGGRVWTLPASLPTGLALRGMRLKAKGEHAALSAAEMASLLRGVFGPAQAEELLDLVPAHHMPALIRQVFDAYDARRSSGNGSAPAPSRAQRRSGSPARRSGGRPSGSRR